MGPLFLPPPYSLILAGGFSSAPVANKTQFRSGGEDHCNLRIEEINLGLAGPIH